MIGILGGFGAVGREVARLLLSWGETALRLGGRHPHAVDGMQSVYVDVGDHDSVMAFAADCRLIINCAAPSVLLSLPVANALLRAGIPLVDAGGLDCPPKLQRQGERPGCRAVFAAGALPGLSGLLPLWLAQPFERVDTLNGWFAVFDRFTASGAEDYLAGVLHTAPSQHDRMRRQLNVTLPFMPRPVTLQPYEDEESRYVDNRLDLRHSNWFLALEGEQLSRALDSARGLAKQDAIDAIVRGSALDVAGLTSRVTFIIQLEGNLEGRVLTRTLLLRAPGIAQLTAACTAACALQLITTDTPRFGLASHCIDPETLMPLLCRKQTGIDIDIFDSGVSQLKEMTGGTL